MILNLFMWHIHSILTGNYIYTSFFEHFVSIAKFQLIKSSCEWRKKEFVEAAATEEILYGTTSCRENNHFSFFYSLSRVLFFIYHIRGRPRIFRLPHH